MNKPLTRLEAYGAALRRFDWQFQFSDDHTVWAAGSNALARLHKMQRQIDPDGVMWLATPGARGHGAPGPQIQRVAA
jgi:hypothetical protein